MTRISPEYLAMQEQFHQQRPDYGISSTRHVETILSLSKELATRDILDYGCGKAMLQKGLPFPIQNYDPCMPEYAQRPDPAAIVVCTDVLEHIEPAHLREVLDDLRSLTKTLLYLDVSCVPASKQLPDGRNAHILQESPNWWLTWLLPRFVLHSFQASAQGFKAVFAPLPEPGPTVNLDATEGAPHA